MPITHLLPLGTSIDGPRKPSNYIANRRKRTPSIKTIAVDSTNYLKSNGVMINALPLKEDTTWMLMLSTPPITLKKESRVNERQPMFLL
jgi:hypothetical protein